MTTLEDQVRDANPQGLGALESSDVVMQYDSDADILYLSVAEPPDAFSLAISDQGLYLRVAVDDYRIVGWDIIGLEGFTAGNKVFGEYIASLLDAFGHADFQAEFKLKKDDGGSGESFEYIRTYVLAEAPQLIAV